MKKKIIQIFGDKTFTKNFPYAENEENNLKLQFLNYGLIGVLILLIFTTSFRLLQSIFENIGYPYIEILVLIILNTLIISTLILLRTKYYGFVYLLISILPLVGLWLYFQVYLEEGARISPSETMALSLVFIGLILPIKYFIGLSILYSIFLYYYYIFLGFNDTFWIVTRVLFIAWISIFILISVVIRSSTFSRLEKQSIELKKKSQMTESLNISLDKKVSERTKELREFVYIVSHDLKSPLNTIHLLVKDLEHEIDNFDSQSTRGILERINTNISGMTNLVDGILDYSNINLSKDKLKIINLNQLLDKVIDSLLPPSNIEIIIQNNLPKIKFDETKLIQLFQNLISNAIKYNDKSNGKIFIKTMNETNNHVEFVISDNGMGIKKENFQKIFELFETGSSAIKSSGVGLAIVKKIVEQLEGEISVESTFSEGSDFKFTVSSKFLI